MSDVLAVPTAEELMARARQRTGLSDFGAPGFREGLEMQLKCLREEPHFSQQGVDALAGQYVERLCARLLVEDWYAKHPEIAAVEPERPVMITGLPRTGTTALAKVLSYEPAFRLLRGWEQHPPVPPPTLETEENDPRRLAMKARFERIAAEDPERTAMHLHELDTAEEDVSLIWMEFKAQSFTAPVFGYHAWWRDCDMRPAYAYQRRVIKLLQSGRGPSRWLFKAPHYAFHLEAVSSAYPDGKFLVTHRDPVKTLPSFASFVGRLMPPGSRERLDPKAFGAHLANHMAIGMRRMIEARERLGDHRFFDVRHHDFVADPIGVLRRIYDFMELPFLPQAQAAMEAWAGRNRPGAHGQHKYAAADIGLDERDIREQFAFYTDRYDVPLEPI